MLEQGFSFEQWVVTPVDRVVSGPRGETKLEPKVMEVFVDLATHAGEVVSRYELIDRIWPGAVVGDEVLSRCIYQIRRALGETSRDARYLETIPKRGYRLNAELIDLSVDTETTAQVAHWPHGSPFRGLEVFDLDHAPVYFGRARATLEALHALQEQHANGKSFLLLLGASGVGKSSLARAGLLHALVTGSAVAHVDHWIWASFRPNDRPAGALDSLVYALGGALTEERAGIVDSMAHLSGEELARQFVETLDECHGEDSAAALLVDQLEELFSTGATTSQQHEFFATLEALATTGRCWIVATLRSDFYPRCAEFSALRRLKKGAGHYDVLPLRPAELGQAIRLPARAAGLVFERDSATGLALDEMLQEAVMAEPRLLPLLEFTLQALYEHRDRSGALTLDAYRRLGGLEGSLAKRADAVFQSLPASIQTALPQVLSRLIRIDGERVSAVRQPISAFPSRDARELVDSFVAARLFYAELDAGDKARIGVTHEALLTHWPRVRDWIAQNRELIRIHDRIVVARQRWDADGRADDLLLPRGRSLEEAEELTAAYAIDLDQAEQEFIDRSARRAARRRLLERLTAIGITALSVVAGGAAWLASEQRDVALAQSAVAEAQSRAAEATSDFLVEIFEFADPSESRDGTLSARDVLDQGVRRLGDGLVYQPALQTRLRFVVARAYSGLGLYSNAEALLRRAVADAADLPDVSERDRLRIRYRLAEVLVNLGDFAEAERIHGEVLAERQALLAPDDLDLADSLHARAHELWRNGFIADAEALFGRVLETRRKQLGDRHREVVDVIGVLGTLNFQLGLRTRAGEFYRRAAELSVEAYGERHVRRAIALSNLASVEEDPQRRKSLLLESLSIRTEVLGAEHPRVARAEEILAAFYAEQGHDQQAEELFLKSISKLERSDEQTLLLPNVQNRYALFLQSRERYAQAAEMFREAVGHFESRLGPDHGHTIIVGSNLAWAMYLAQDTVGAETMMRELLATGESPAAGYGFVLAGVKRNLARVLLSRGEIDEARTLVEAAVVQYEKDRARYAVALADALATLAEVQLAGGDTHGALRSARRALMTGGDVEDWRKAAYRSLAGAAEAASGNCDAGIALLEDAQRQMPDTKASAREMRRIHDRLGAAYANCGRGSAVPLAPRSPDWPPADF